MLSRRIWGVQAVAITSICILLDLAGKNIAIALSLPLRLDCGGTMMSAFLLGPVGGAAVGFSAGAIQSILFGGFAAYALPGAAIGLSVGLVLKKRRVHTLFGASSLGILVTLVSVLTSVPLNLLILGGGTGNVWGDGVSALLSDWGVSRIFCVALGEFYIDFMDRMLTVVAVSLAVGLWLRIEKIKIRKRMRNPKNPEKAKKTEEKIGKTAKVLASLLLILALPKSQEILAENYDSYIQTVYSSTNGLPCGEANDIAQTNDGILWIGTYAGLYRYNGRTFRWMNEYDSVRNVNCLYVDEEGRLWIGTNDSGLSICINERVVNVVNEDMGLPSNSVRSIVKSSDGLYYVGTSGAMAVISLDSGLKIVGTLPDVVYATSLSAGADGVVSCVTSGGELLLLRDRRKVLSRSLSDDREMFNSCAFAEDGTLRVGTTTSRLLSYRLTGSALELEKAESCQPLSHLNSIYTAPTGELFVSADNGIGYFSGREFRNINLKTFNNSIDSITSDYQGNMWFSSSRQGVLRLSGSSFTDIYSKIGLRPKVVNTVAERGGLLYFGTDSGLDVVDERTYEPVRESLAEILEGVRIRCIMKDTKENLWISTYGEGLFCVGTDGSLGKFDSGRGMFGEWVRVTIEHSDGTILSAGDTGLSFIKNGKIEDSIKYGKSLTSAMILCLLELPDGTVLAGSDGDGIAVIRDRKVVRKLSKADGLTSGVVMRAVLSSNGAGVFLVTSNSLCYMDLDTYSVRPLRHFPYFNNYDVWGDGRGSIFVLGSAGIYVVDEFEAIADEAAVPFTLLDSRTGLNSNLTANSWNWKDGEGNLYLSCGTGVFCVNMNTYRTGRKAYRMKLSEIAVEGERHRIERGTPFTIARDAKRIELFPEIINYTVFDPVISYSLEGFSKGRTTLSQSELSSVTYTNLPAGSYSFRISVLDSSGEEIESSSYALVKERNIQDNPYFIVYMIFVAMVAVAWLTWLIFRAQVQRTLTMQRRTLEMTRRQAEMGNATVLAIAKAVDAKDENTAQHSHRVSEYSVLIARELGFREGEIENLRKAALLHDIGKIGIPDSVLKKPSRLTDDEYALMKQHVTRGAEILKDFTMIEHVSDGVLYHHEKWDGTGYAMGLRGEEIPLYGRIIGMADAFDAMTANRVYRKRLDLNFVIGEIERCRGTQFDPKIADIMLGLISSGKVSVESIYREAEK